MHKRSFPSIYASAVHIIHKQCETYVYPRISPDFTPMIKAIQITGFNPIKNPALPIPQQKSPLADLYCAVALKNLPYPELIRAQQHISKKRI